MEYLFECSISFTYNAENPADAVAQFMANLKHSDWFVEVRNTETNESFTVDTEDYSVEKNPIIKF